MSQAAEQIAGQYSAAAKNKAIWKDIIYNVKDELYGAKGDGVTDDTAAIQKAVNEASAAGGEVRFPPGAYRLEGTVDLSALKLIVITGSGQSSTFLKIIGATNSGLKTLNCRLILRNISLSGESAIEAHGQPVNGYGIDATDNRSGKSVLENVSFYNLKHGIHADVGEHNASFYDSIFDNCLFFNCDIGFQSRELNNAFRSTNFRLCDTGIAFYKKLEQIHLSNTVFTGCNVDVRVEDHGGALHFEDCWFENDGERSLGLGNGNVIASSLASGTGMIKNIKFENCYFSKYTKFQTMDWIYSSHRRRVNIEGCTFDEWPNDMAYMNGFRDFTFQDNAHVDSVGNVKNTRNTGISATFPTSAVGLQSFQITHGLSYIPSDVSIRMQVIRPTDPDMACSATFYDVTDTVIHARVYVSKAGGAGSTAKIAWEASIGV